MCISTSLCFQPGLALLLSAASLGSLLKAPCLQWGLFTLDGWNTHASQTSELCYLFSSQLPGTFISWVVLSPAGAHCHRPGGLAFAFTASVRYSRDLLLTSAARSLQDPSPQIPASSAPPISNLSPCSVWTLPSFAVNRRDLRQRAGHSLVPCVSGITVQHSQLREVWAQLFHIFCQYYSCLRRRVIWVPVIPSRLEVEDRAVFPLLDSLMR